MRDFYYILGIDIGSSPDEIRDAYRKLSKKFHPDLNGGDTYFAGRFREINEAYETLNDPAKRKKYDTDLKKVKVNPIDEEFERRQAQRQQDTTGQMYRAHRHRRGPGVGISIVLVVVGLIFAVYLVKSFSGSKTKIVTLVAAQAPVYKAIRKHHKRKHAPGNTVTQESALTKTDDTGTRRVSAINIKLPEAKILPAKQIEITSPAGKAFGKSPDFLYSTVVKPNITGIVNMREFGRYDSPVIAVIPADSKVYVIERGTGYYKVAYNNNTGYVPKWALETK
ncbi:MAG TPA: DnaJ domain-containing protein [Mucilaginibacter sp.]|jgi:curved DNA-binding protein CbpA|nr:DnaJ domain-containing protein [Mucilaginibacter sp.]